MDITWYGYNSFGLKTKDGTMIVDPYKNDVGLKFPSVKSNVVVISDEENKSNNSEGVDGEPKILTWPGEYEVAGIAITGMEISEQHAEATPLSGASTKGTQAKKSSAKDAASTTKSSPKKSRIYSFDADGLKVCYITDFDVPLSEELMESIGDVDVLLVPVKGNLEEMHKVIEEIEPRIVIPIGYKTGGLKVEAGDLEAFMKKSGAPTGNASAKFSVNSRNDLPQEKTEFVILSAQHA